MSELSIKIKIGDREYPMRVEASEEARLRSAGRVVNEQMKVYHSQFGIDDKQDLLAMVAFDAMVEKMRTESGSSNTEGTIHHQLEHLDKILSEIVGDEPA